MEVAAALIAKLSEEVTDTLEGAEQKAKEENISGETISHMGGPAYHFIVQEAKDKKIDLIVMGPHGKTGLKRVIMGSVAERVLGSAPCPVLVTPL